MVVFVFYELLVLFPRTWTGNIMQKRIEEADMYKVSAPAAVYMYMNIWMSVLVSYTKR